MCPPTRSSCRSSEEFTASGVGGAAVPARPQMTRLRELPAGAVLFGAGHAPPTGGRGPLVQMTASVTSNANRLTARAPGKAGCDALAPPELFAFGPTRMFPTQPIGAVTSLPGEMFVVRMEKVCEPPTGIGFPVLSNTQSPPATLPVHCGRVVVHAVCRKVPPPIGRSIRTDRISIRRGSCWC